MCGTAGDGQILNEYFASVFTVEEDVQDIERGELNGNIFKNVRITEEMVLDVLKCLKVHKPLGTNQVTPRAQWEVREVIARPLAEVFVSSIATGEVPEDWRLANIVPLFKKGGKEKLGNYRPMSRTSVV
eukprot:g29014.t1